MSATSTTAARSTSPSAAGRTTWGRSTERGRRQPRGLDPSRHAHHGEAQRAGHNHHPPRWRRAGVSRISSWTGGGKLDLTNNKLIDRTAADLGQWSGTGYTGLLGEIQQGRNGDALPLWDGAHGILTSQTAATSGNLTSIGIAKATQVRPATVSTTEMWAGQTITGTDILIMYTYGGDANLDGRINIDDYVKIDVGAVLGLSGWSNGDFNYDGTVNIDDYTTIIDPNIANQRVFTRAAACSGSLSGVTAIRNPPAPRLSPCSPWASLRGQAVSPRGTPRSCKLTRTRSGIHHARQTFWTQVRVWAVNASVGLSAHPSRMLGELRAGPAREHAQRRVVADRKISRSTSATRSR